MFARTSTGIELAGDDLRVAVVQLWFGKFRLIRNASIDRFSSLSPEEQIESIRSLFARYRIPTSRVWVTLAHDCGIVRQADLPSAAAGDIAEAVALQLDSFSPWPLGACRELAPAKQESTTYEPSLVCKLLILGCRLLIPDRLLEDIYWDCSNAKPSRADKTIKVSIAIIPRETLDPWVELLRSAGVHLAGASLAPLAWGHATQTLWPEGRTVVLGCEPDYVEGMLNDGGRLVAVTDRGSNTAGQARASMQRIAALGRLSAGEDVRLIVHGASSEELDSEQLRLPIEGAPESAVRKFGAIAASLAGIGNSAFSTNLMPVATRYRPSHVKLIPTYALLLLLVVMGAGFLVREGYQNLTYAAEVDAEIQNVSRQVAEITEMEAELNLLNDEYEALVGHIRSRDSNLEALRELAVVMPFSTFLSDFRYQPGVITITGFSETPSELQRLIDESPLFADVEFTSALVRDSSGKDRFTIRARIEAAQ